MGEIMNTSVAFRVKDLADADSGQSLVRDWLQMVNAETAALSPWFEWQAEWVRQAQQHAMEPWLSLWAAMPRNAAARH
jgi:hypothetical protein